MGGGGWLVGSFFFQPAARKLDPPAVLLLRSAPIRPCGPSRPPVAAAEALTPAVPSCGRLVCVDGKKWDATGLLFHILFFIPFYHMNNGPCKNKIIYDSIARSYYLPIIVMVTAFSFMCHQYHYHIIIIINILFFIITLYMSGDSKHLTHK